MVFSRRKNVRSVFLHNNKAIHQIGLHQTALQGYLAVHQVGEDHGAVLALDAHHIAQDHILRLHFILINGRKAHALALQSGQHHGKAHVALLKIGHSGHDLLIGHGVAGLLQLGCQIGQLLGVGGIVAYHILHEGGQLLHLAVLAGSAAAAVGMVMATAMFVVMLVIVAMAMLVIVAVATNVIVVQMHKKRSFKFFLYYNPILPGCQFFIFPMLQSIFCHAIMEQSHNSRRNSMKFFDIHTHVYPDAIAQKATDSIKDFYNIGGAGMNGTTSMLLSRGKEAGIERFLILPVAVNPARVHSINDFIVQQLQLHPEFVGFGTVHAAMDGLMDETQRILDLGLRGIKMHPDTQAFSIDDPRLFPVYEHIAGRIPVILHMGDHRYDYSQPAKLRHVLEEFPKLEAIAAHFGGYTMYDIAYEELNGTNCIFDVSSCMMFMEKGEAERYINLYGAERMAYGTDYPLWDPVTEVKRFLELDLTDDQFEQIAHKTAERLLKL